MKYEQTMIRGCETPRTEKTRALKLRERMQTENGFDSFDPEDVLTAVIGLADKPQRARIRGCAFCSLREGCAYRERGMTCASST